MFRSRLDNILNSRHPLFKLPNKIDWSVFEQQIGALYVEKVGRPGLPIRLLLGLHYLKTPTARATRASWRSSWRIRIGSTSADSNISSTTFRWDPSTLVRWRKRVGPEGMEKLFKETIAAAQRENLLRRSDVSRAIVDTTVQEKAIAFPTDARLYHKARRTLVRAAKEEGISLRQSYELLGTKTFARQSRYAHARQGKRAGRETRKLKTFLGRVIRDLQRKRPIPSPQMAGALVTAQRIFFQKRQDSPKVYSMHAPETECIAKGRRTRNTGSGARSRWFPRRKRNG